MPSLSPDDIRHFVADYQVREHSIDLDLEFSSEELQSAMRRAAAHYNSIPPLIHNLSPQGLYSDSIHHMAGVAYHLYLSKRMQLAKDDIDFTAGGVTGNRVSRRIQHIDKILPEFFRIFEEGTKAFKITLNRHAGMGQVG